MGPAQIDALTEICHGTPFDEDHYVFDGNDATMALNSASRPLCLYGHTHLPAIFRVVDHDMASFEGDAPDPDREVVVRLQRGTQYLINAGSIGQPRDGDPRAGYGVLDDEAREIRLYRVRLPDPERAAEDHGRRPAGESRESLGAGTVSRTTADGFITKVTKITKLTKRLCGLRDLRDLRDKPSARVALRAARSSRLLSSAA